MEVSDPYDVLGVEEGASEAEVKRAYRAKVKRHHPDVSEDEDAEREFRRIKDAYDAIVSGDAAGETGSRGGRSRRKNEEHRSSGTRERRGSQGGLDDDSETMETYSDGWRLAVCSDGERVGEWFVYRATGSGARYVTRDGEVSRERTYFGTRKQAEVGYERYAGGSGDGRSGEGRNGSRSGGGGTTDASKRSSESRRGRGRHGASARRSTEPGDDVDGEEVGGFDSLWSLYRRERGEGAVWAVVSSISTPYYLNEAGEQQREPFWFAARAEAEAAYDAYMRGAADVGGPSRNLTGGVSDDTDSGSGEERARNVVEGVASSRPPVSVAGKLVSWLDELGPGASVSAVRNAPAPVKGLLLASALAALLAFLLIV